MKILRPVEKSLYNNKSKQNFYKTTLCIHSMYSMSYAIFNMNRVRVKLILKDIVIHKPILNHINVFHTKSRITKFQISTNEI